MSFELNEEEKTVLKTLAGLDKEKKGIQYYSLIDALNLKGDTSGMIPVVGRLEDDGYITSNGLIYRNIFLTEKGQREIGI
jgi:Mn-dependent DtxR family transcriptional regulator